MISVKDAPAGADVGGDGRLREACDRVDKGAGANVCLSDYDNVEDVLGVWAREWGKM